MIILDNHSKYNTYIIIENEKYSVVDAESIEGIEQGDGGFSENGDLLGLYVDKDKLYFQYNNNNYEAKAHDIECTNIILNDGKREFKVKIKDLLICDIVYKPYIDPLALIVGSDDDEFDFLLRLSRVMESEDSILDFIKGIKNLYQARGRI